MNDFKTGLPESLVKAYRSTNYEVHTDPAFIIKIGEFSSGLRNLFRKLNLSTGYFITACNPQGIELSNAKNRSLHNALRNDLQSSGHHIVNGFGSDPSGTWDGEPSFLVLGISLGQAKSLAVKFKQNAIVGCDETCIPDLLLLR